LISKVDLEARKKAIKVINEKIESVIKQIESKKPPYLEIPKRTLSNAIYDKEKKLLLLGPSKLKRSLLDMNESKRFMQTILVTKIIYEALLNNEYPTIRDIYYRGNTLFQLRTKTGRFMRKTRGTSRRNRTLL